MNQLNLSNAAPRLAVATHCQFEDDTTNAVMTDIRSWYTGPVALVKDLQVSGSGYAGSSVNFGGPDYAPVWLQ